jgi:ankyrin repeat protein
VLVAVVAALSHGREVNTVNPTGETALHIAAALGYDTVVRALAAIAARTSTCVTRAA